MTQNNFSNFLTGFLKNVIEFYVLRPNFREVCNITYAKGCVKDTWACQFAGISKFYCKSLEWMGYYAFAS